MENKIKERIFDIIDTETINTAIANYVNENYVIEDGKLKVFVTENNFIYIAEKGDVHHTQTWAWEDFRADFEEAIDEELIPELEQKKIVDSKEIQKAYDTFFKEKVKEFAEEYIKILKEDGFKVEKRTTATIDIKNRGDLRILIQEDIDPTERVLDSKEMLEAIEELDWELEPDYSFKDILFSVDSDGNLTVEGKIEPIKDILEKYNFEWDAQKERWVKKDIKDIEEALSIVREVKKRLFGDKTLATASEDTNKKVYLELSLGEYKQLQQEKQIVTVENAPELDVFEHFVEQKGNYILGYTEGDVLFLVGMGIMKVQRDMLDAFIFASKGKNLPTKFEDNGSHVVVIWG